VRHFRDRNPSLDPCWNADFGFWIFTVVWLVYRAVLLILRHSYSDEQYRILGDAGIDLLGLIPVALVILIICEKMVSLNEMKSRVLLLVRVVFCSFLFVVGGLGAMLALIDWGPEDLLIPVKLWRGCVDLLVAVYVGFPSYRLIQSSTMGFVIPEEGPCVKASKVCVVIYSGLYFARSVYNLTDYWNKNKIEDWWMTQVESNKMVHVSGQVFSFLWIFVFEIVTSVVAIYAVDMIHRYKLKEAAKNIGGNDSFW
jgi:hypothetical protein